MVHIIILGTGTAGMPATSELRERLVAPHQITVANAVDYFQFVPFNPWVAVGWRQRGDISFPIRPQGARYRAARVLHLVLESAILKKSHEMVFKNGRRR